MGGPYNGKDNTMVLKEGNTMVLTRRHFQSNGLSNSETLSFLKLIKIIAFPTFRFLEVQVESWYFSSLTRSHNTSPTTLAPSLFHRFGGLDKSDYNRIMWP